MESRTFSPLTMLVYGVHGIGKTVFLGSVIDVPELQPVLLLDYESGTRSIKSKINKIEINELGKKIEPGKIDSIKIRSWKDFDVILDYIYSKGNVYKSVLVDSVTEINMLCVETVVKTINSQRYAPGVPSQNDYGVSTTYMRKVLRSLRNLAEDINISIFISASEDTEKDEMTGIVKARPNLTNKLQGDIQGFFDIVAYYRLNKRNKRELVFQPGAKYDAKAREEDECLGEYLEEPTINKIIELLKE